MKNKLVCIHPLTFCMTASAFSGKKTPLYKVGVCSRVCAMVISLSLTSVFSPFFFPGRTICTLSNRGGHNFFLLKIFHVLFSLEQTFHERRQITNWSTWVSKIQKNDTCEDKEENICNPPHRFRLKNECHTCQTFPVAKNKSFVDNL